MPITTTALPNPVSIDESTALWAIALTLFFIAATYLAPFYFAKGHYEEAKRRGSAQAFLETYFFYLMGLFVGFWVADTVLTLIEAVFKIPAHDLIVLVVDLGLNALGMGGK